jgi:hypothetical protein
MMTDVAGTVYLLHFCDAQGNALRLKHAGHYMGWSSDLDARLAAHRGGTGARLMEVITNAGIDWKLVRTWTGTRKLERKLKNRGGHARVCPVCREEA